MSVEHHKSSQEPESSFETDIVSQWLLNDETIYLALQAALSVEPDMDEVAMAVQNFVTQHNPLEGTYNLYSSLLEVALQNVDWNYVASTFLDE